MQTTIFTRFFQSKIRPKPYLKTLEHCGIISRRPFTRHAHAFDM